MYSGVLTKKLKEVNVEQDDRDSQDTIRYQHQMLSDFIANL